MMSLGWWRLFFASFVGILFFQASFSASEKGIIFSFHGFMLLSFVFYSLRDRLVALRTPLFSVHVYEKVSKILIL